MMRIVCLVAWLLAALVAAPAAGRDGTTTNTEIRSELPSRTHADLGALVWDMFEREDLRREVAPVNPLTDLWLSTKIRGAHVPGLCRYDSVRIEFAPTKREDRGADTPVQPVALRSSSAFALLAPPPGSYHKAEYSRFRPSDRECRKLSRKSQRFFAAEDEETAYDGYRAWLALRAALEAKKAVPLECDLFDRETRSCEEVVLAYRPDEVERIESCDTPEHQLCHRARFADHEITMLVTGHSSRGPPEGEIVSAAVDGLITLWHPRID
jgi:hypothetical protein